jgi:hypothetical protein
MGRLALENLRMKNKEVQTFEVKVNTCSPYQPHLVLSQLMSIPQHIRQINTTLSGDATLRTAMSLVLTSLDT